MTNMAAAAFLQRETSRASHADDMDSARGRTRDRSLSRASVSKPLRPDESSTLRGRSRRRATSPGALTSRNSSPSLGSILYHRLKEPPRREHCPSRPASSSARRTSSPRRRQQRVRSQSRNAARAAMENHRGVLETQHSGLRNEIMIPEESPVPEVTVGDDGSPRN